MTDQTAHKALSAWGKTDATITLAAQRENIVYRVEHRGARFALRLHRPGYQSAQMIRAELAWIAHLGAQGLTVPTPLATQSGTRLHRVDGYDIDLLTWLDGAPMGATGRPLQLSDRTGTFHKTGQLMARLHQISDGWTPPADFERQRWDIAGLLGDTPLWGRFWDNPGLSRPDRTRILEARDRLRTDLAAPNHDFGLIHADMLRENVMLCGTDLGLIDFDDSGFGFRLFDVATALIKNRAEPDYTALEAAFLQGYRSLRPLDTTHLPAFKLIRALSYLGWILARMDEPGAPERQTRFLRDYQPLLEEYFAG